MSTCCYDVQRTQQYGYLDSGQFLSTSADSATDRAEMAVKCWILLDFIHKKASGCYPPTAEDIQNTLVVGLFSV